MEFDSDGDVPSMTVALPVDKDIHIERDQLNTFIPTSGAQLLAMIRAERSFLPDITICNDIPKIAQFPTKESIDEYPENILPSDEFRKKQIQLFNQARENFERKKSKYKNKEPDIKIPLTKNSWTEFFDKNSTFKITPHLTIITKIRQAGIFRALLGLNEWMEGNDLTDLEGMWLYALLASSVLPLFPDFHSLLREINRKLIKERREISLEEQPNSERLGRINLFIIIICDYFGQSDMIFL